MKPIPWVTRIADWLRERRRLRNLPEPGPDRGVYITATQARAIINKALGSKLLTRTYIRLPDTKFYCPSVQYCKRLMALDQIDRERYEAEKADCDKFSWMLKAAFVRDAWRDKIQRAAHCFGVFDYSRKSGPGHSINWVINDDRVFRLIEPQDDSWPDLSDPEIVKARAVIA